jgi:hypothetical protein
MKNEAGLCPMKRTFDACFTKGTLHLDNFCIAENFGPRTEMHEQDEARNKMLDYIIGLGIDVKDKKLPLKLNANQAVAIIAD